MFKSRTFTLQRTICAKMLYNDEKLKRKSFDCYSTNCAVINPPNDEEVENTVYRTYNMYERKTCTQYKPRKRVQHKKKIMMYCYRGKKLIAAGSAKLSRRHKTVKFKKKRQYLAVE